MKSFFENLINKLSQSKIDVINITHLINNITKTINFLNIYDSIYIPFLGASNAGKSTIINGIIGRDILPTDLSECTKRGIIIHYCNEDGIIIKKAKFLEKKILKKYYYTLSVENIIGKGEKEVKEILNGLNYDYTDKEEHSFYFIETKIKLFDELGLNDSLKSMIYLIDFPGYGTKNKFMEKEICKKIMSISSAFFFTLRNSIIKENNTKLLVDSLFNQVKSEKKKLYSGIFSSFFFILNNDSSQTINENDLERAKNDIKEIIDDDDNINKEKIQFCFFNSKYYCDYCNELNYFYNLEETLDMEYNNYLRHKNNIFKWPEIFNGKKSKSFFDYLYHFISFYLEHFLFIFIITFINIIFRNTKFYVFSFKFIFYIFYY